MPFRICLVPLFEVTKPSGSIYRGPKYFDDGRDAPDPPLFPSVPYELRDFGLEPTGLLAANLTTAQASTLNAQPDVTLIPANLDNQIDGQLNNVVAALESLHIPGDALDATNTYRQVVRGVVAIFAVAALFHQEANARLFPAGITLSTTLGDLSQAIRNQLQAAATELGYDYDGLTLQSTLRDVLKKLATQQAPFTMLNVTI
jgi:hypothetical protein